MSPEIEMKLLAAVDLHDHTSEFLDEIARWALACDAVVDLAYVDEYRYTAALLPDPQVRIALEQQWERVRDANVAALEAAMQRLPGQVRGEARYLVGRASDELVAAAPTYDGLIVGTHGRTGLGYVLLGSVAERVVRRASVPVLTLRLASAEEGA